MIEGTPHVVYLGKGDQTVSTVIRSARGLPTRPSSAPTYSLDDLRYHVDDSTRVVQSGTASLDSVSTTTTAAVGQGQADRKLVPVNSATGITEGKRYLLSSGASREMFRVASISGTNVYAEDEIAGAFASGASVLGLEVSITFPTATANDTDEGYEETRFAWDMTVSGVEGTPYAREFIVLRRVPATTRATVEDLLDLDPTLRTVARDRGPTSKALRVAQRVIDAKLRSVGRDPTTFDGGETQRLAEAYLALEHIYANLISADGTGGAYEMKRERVSELGREHLRDLTHGQAPGDATETTRAEDYSPGGPPEDFTSPFRHG